VFSVFDPSLGRGLGELATAFGAAFAAGLELFDVCEADIAWRRTTQGGTADFPNRFPSGRSFPSARMVYSRKGPTQPRAHKPFIRSRR